MLTDLLGNLLSAEILLIAKLFNMIIEFDTCFVDNFDWGREKTCIFPSGKLFTDNTFTAWLQ